MPQSLVAGEDNVEAVANQGVDRAGLVCEPHERPVSAEAQTFLDGRDLGALLVANIPEDEAAALTYLEVTKPAAEALAAEVGSSMSASKRLAIQMAASAYGDHVFFTRAARRQLHGGVGSRNDVARAVEAYSRAAERAARVVLASIEALRRPGQGRIDVRVGEAGNVNVGEQHVHISGDGPQTLVGGKRRGGQ